MADIGTLVVKMAADSAQMRSEIDKMQRQMKTSGDAVAALNKSLKMVGGAVLAAFSVGQVVAFAGRCIEAADALQDMSDKLGMSAAQLNLLQLAATQSGGSVDGVNTALTKMSSTLGDAVNGQKEASKAFASLNLNAAELAQLAPDQAFIRISDALAGIENPYQRAAAAQDIFGKGAKDIAGLLAEGSSGINEVGVRLEEMGAKLTDLDISRIAQMKDEAAFVGTAFQNLATVMISNASPAMGVLLDSFSNLMKTFGGADQAGRYFGITVVALIKAVEALAQTVIAVFEHIRGVLIGIGAGALDIVGIFSDGAQQMANAWTASANSALANSERAAGAALQAGRDVFNAATIFDEKARKMEERAAAAAAKITSVVGPTGPGEKTAAERRMEGVDGRQQGLDLTSMMTDQQMIEALKVQHYGNLETLQSDHIQRVVDQAAWQYSTMGQLAQLFGIEYQDLQTQQYDKEMTLRESLFSAGTSIMGALFASDKKFAIAQALISTYAGAARAYKDVPYPANIAAVASIIASGLKQVAQIRKTQPGSSSGGSAGSAGVSSSAAMPRETPGLQQQQPSRIAQVVVQGSVFSSRETADWLIGQLSEAINDRDVVFINGNSRQAGLIGGT